MSGVTRIVAVSWRFNLVNFQSQDLKPFTEIVSVLCFATHREVTQASHSDISASLAAPQRVQLLADEGLNQRQTCSTLAHIRQQPDSSEWLYCLPLASCAPCRSKCYILTWISTQKADHDQSSVNWNQLLTRHPSPSFHVAAVSGRHRDLSALLLHDDLALRSNVCG